MTADSKTKEAKTDGGWVVYRTKDHFYPKTELSYKQEGMPSLPEYREKMYSIRYVAREIDCCGSDANKETDGLKLTLDLAFLTPHDIGGEVMLNVKGSSDKWNPRAVNMHDAYVIKDADSVDIRNAYEKSDPAMFFLDASEALADNIGCKSWEYKLPLQEHNRLGELIDAVHHMKVQVRSGIIRDLKATKR